MSKPIQQLVDELPTSNLTVSALRSLDFIAPGQWQNVVGFVNTIKTVTGETDEDIIQQIGDQAIYLYNDRSQGYQRAIWVYETVDSTDKALGAAILANKEGEKIPFLNTITPKAEKAQAIDLCLKLVGELVAFCSINRIHEEDSIREFILSLEEYSGEAVIRMVALVCFDGLIPLGPDFLRKTISGISQTSPNELEKNSTFQKIKDAIPGDNSHSKLNFIAESFNSVKGWMSSLVSSNYLTPQKIFHNLQDSIDFPSNYGLDYLGAFLDVSTNYYEHTGTQTVARRLIERAVTEI